MRRIESACGETRDRNRWNVYCHVPLRLFHLRTGIELLHAFIRQNVHPLTAATFGDWLSPRGQVQYHKFRTVTIGLDDNNRLIRAMVESRLQCYGIFPKFQTDGSRVLSSPIYIYVAGSSHALAYRRPGWERSGKRTFLPERLE